MFATEAAAMLRDFANHARSASCSVCVGWWLHCWAKRLCPVPQLTPQRLICWTTKLRLWEFALFVRDSGATSNNYHGTCQLVAVGDQMHSGCPSRRTRAARFCEEKRGFGKRRVQVPACWEGVATSEFEYRGIREGFTAG